MMLRTRRYDRNYRVCNKYLCTRDVRMLVCACTGDYNYCFSWSFATRERFQAKWYD